MKFMVSDCAHWDISCIIRCIGVIGDLGASILVTLVAPLADRTFVLQAAVAKRKDCTSHDTAEHNFDDSLIMRGLLEILLHMHPEALTKHIVFLVFHLFALRAIV